MKKFILFLQILFLYLFSFSQNLNLEVIQKGVFDDREYVGIYKPLNQVIFGESSRINLVLNADSNHSIHVGYSNFYEFGAPLKDIYHFLSAFYNFNKSFFDFKIGLFDRTEYTNQFPICLIDPVYQYYRHNIEGVGISVNKNFIKVKFFCDWNSRQTFVKNERFNIGTDLKLTWKKLYSQTFFSMQHLAGKSDTTEPQGLRDNLQVLTGIGWSDTLIKNLHLDLFASYLVGWDRNRGYIEVQNYDWVKANGLFAQAKIKYKYFGVNYYFYYGQSQNIFLGNPFYGSNKPNFTNINFDYTGKRIYHRIELLAFYENKNLNANFRMAFHITDGGLQLQPILQITYKLGVKLYQAKPKN